MQTLTPDSSTTVFTLNYSVPSPSSIIVFYGGVPQEPGVAYTVVGNQITFTGTPVTGVTLYVHFLGTSLNLPTPADASVTKAKLGTTALWQTITPITLSTGSPTSVTLASGLSDIDTIEIYLLDSSTNTANQSPLIQLGDSGGIETTGYNSQGIAVSATINLNTTETTGFPVSEESTYDAATVGVHSITLKHMGSNLWVFASQGWSGGTIRQGQGVKTLSGALTQLVLTTSGGSATFDGGTAYARYK
jgi:hypothetical protein